MSQHGNGQHQNHHSNHQNTSHRFTTPVVYRTGGHGFDLSGAALDEMHAAGFKPEFGAGVAEQVAALRETTADRQPEPGVEDLRTLGWSSIDNDTSRDLDQIEFAERVPDGIHLRIAIGDVAAAVPKGSPIDKHAEGQTQTIYTAVKNFPMLPFDLSTDMTSLNEDADREAIMMSFTVGPTGAMSDEKVSRAFVRNRAQLAYSRVGPWLENTAAGAPMGAAFDLRSDSARAAQPQAEAQTAPTLPQGWLEEQLKLQDEAAQALHKTRVENGALEFHRAEADPVVADGKVVDVQEAIHNRAMDLIEDLMVAANGVMARALRHGGRSGLQRVVRIPVRWDRIVALAAGHNGSLPPAPDSVALNDFLEAQRKSDLIHYPDLAVAVIKLMGPGEYMLMRPDDDPTGHFGLAARDYTHSTAPNRRFPDLVTQRVLHAMLANAPAPYSDAELMAIAQHCNDADKALRKIERDMQKRVAAVALANRIGQTFSGVITGSSDKGVYVRVFSPPAEGRVMQGEEGLDVGDKVTVKLLHTDPARAFIDFAHVGAR
jgi:exoribonuclease-2